jgi:hypothetical protein
LELFLVTRAVIHSHEDSQQAAKSAPVVASQTSQPPVAPAKPSAGRDDAPGPAMKAPVNTAATTTSSTAVWRVVAYTYNKQDQAEHKAQAIAQKNPQLQPSVFSPTGKGAPYLVTLGGAMDRDAAIRLRAQAIRLGMPGDTFARNYRTGR